MEDLPGHAALNVRPRRRVTPSTALLLVSLGAAPLAGAAPHRPLTDIVELEWQAASALEHLAAGDIERAAVLSRQLARRFPRFALGQLLHAELSAQAALDGTLVASRHPWSPALIDLLLEARTRLTAPPRAFRRAPATLAPDPPAPFVQLGRGVEHLVTVDLERSTLALHTVRGGIATPVREHYVASGSAGFGKRHEGDRKTPLGLYRITGFRDDAVLPELYGAGALTLDYPNAYDRALGRTGSGIWLHGVPRARLSRAPRSSEGCVTMSNDHLLALRERLDPRTTVVMLTDTPRTPPALARAAARRRYRTLFREWRDARVRQASTPHDPLADAIDPRLGTSGTLSAADVRTLGSVDANDVTILESTVDGRDGPPSLLIMTFGLRASEPNGATLYWTRPASGDGWALTLEDMPGAGV